MSLQWNSIRELQALYDVYQDSIVFLSWTSNSIHLTRLLGVLFTVNHYHHYRIIAIECGGRCRVGGSGMEIDVKTSIESLDGWIISLMMLWHDFINSHHNLLLVCVLSLLSSVKSLLSLNLSRRCVRIWGAWWFDRKLLKNFECCDDIRVSVQIPHMGKMKDDFGWAVKTFLNTSHQNAKWTSLTHYL